MNFKKLLLLVGDIIVYYLALALTLIIRYQEFPPSAERVQLHFWPFTFVLALWLVVFLITNLYSLSFSKNEFTFLSAWFSASAVNLFLAFVFFYVVPTGLKPRANMFLLAALFFLLQYLWRTLFQRFVSSEYFQRPTLFIGGSAESLKLANLISKKPGLGFRVAGFYRSDRLSARESIPIHKFPTFPNQESLTAILEQYAIKCVVLDEDLNDQDVIKDMFSALSRSILLYSTADFSELITGKVPVTIIKETWFLQNIAKKEHALYESVKRTADIAGSLLFLIPSLLITPFVAALIKLSSNGPVFFRQIRVGRLGKPFGAIKFRSMSVGSDKNGPAWAVPNDPRVTRFGKFMRKTRLDEIPQLINVFKGDMSFVGPRPERPELVEQLKRVIPFYNERQLVKPGLTGWSQVTSDKYPTASVEDTLEKLQYDLYYIKNRSLWLDLIIILKTIKTVLTGAGQ